MENFRLQYSYSRQRLFTATSNREMARLELGFRSTEARRVRGSLEIEPHFVMAI